jgi:pimeloyl-ACP methyl ester carboxylesterase
VGAGTLAASRALGVPRHGFQYDARPGTFTPTDVETYTAAWSQRGAATAMINDYRAAVRKGPSRTKARLAPLRAPTLIIWGECDRYLGNELRCPEPRAGGPLAERVALGPPRRARKSDTAARKFFMDTRERASNA